MTLTRDGDALLVHPAGQPVLRMGYDSAGDFFPRGFDAILRPGAHGDGRVTGFTWLQGGGAVPATRIGTDAAGGAGFRVDPARLDDYTGRYPLTPDFALTVRREGDTLTVQGTGQPPIAVDPRAPDVFAADAVGAEIRFERDAGRIVALVLHQAGQTLRGERE